VPLTPSVVVTTAPTSWTGGEASTTLDADGALRSGLARARSSRLVSSQAEYAAAPAGCSEDAGCLLATAKRTGASKLAQVRIASLGTTTLVRVVVFDIARGTQEQTRQELVREADDRAVSEAIAHAAEVLARPWAPSPPAERSAAWYESGWLWGSLGAAVVGGAALAIGVSTGGADPSAASKPSEQPDFTLTPP